MIQQIANRNGFAIRGEIGKHIGEFIVVAQFSIMHEQHDRHGGKLFCERREPKICGWRNLKLRTQVAHSVAALENCLAILADDYSEAGIARRSYRGKNGVNLFRARVFRGGSVDCEDQKQGQRGDRAQKQSAQGFQLGFSSVFRVPTTSNGSSYCNF